MREVANLGYVHRTFRKNTMSWKKADLTDIFGMKCNFLTVQDVYKKKTYPNCNSFEYSYLCKCDCGNEVWVRRGTLRNKKVKSCGCANLEVNLKNALKGAKSRRLSGNEAAIKGTLNQYKQNARIKDREFSLTYNDFVKITGSKCYYCNSELYLIQKTKAVFPDEYKPIYIHNGIDRIDSSKGYSIENSVPCCIKCNKSKSNLTLEEFKEHIIKIYNHMKLEKIL